MMLVTTQEVNVEVKTLDCIGFQQPPIRLMFYRWNLLMLTNSCGECYNTYRIWKKSWKCNFFGLDLEVKGYSPRMEFRMRSSITKFSTVLYICYSIAFWEEKAFLLKVDDVSIADLKFTIEEAILALLVPVWIAIYCSLVTTPDSSPCFTFMFHVTHHTIHCSWFTSGCTSLKWTVCC